VIGGFLLIVMGIFRLGRYVVYIPTPVITGFTCGIATIIIISQIDTMMGIHTPSAETGIGKIIGYFTQTFTVNATAILCTILTIGLLWSCKRFLPQVPDALVAILITTTGAWLLALPIDRIGELPHTILLTEHLQFGDIPWNALSDVSSAGVTIAILAAIESLMTGTAGAAMSGKPFDPDQELIAQGAANMVVPWFGGVPSSAAISRTAVAIRSGAQTRVTSIIHAIVLLACVLFLGPLIATIPMASLAGVLLWTAWNMCDWQMLRRFWHAKLTHPWVGVLVTLGATVVFDVTQAILIGIVVSSLAHLRHAAESASVTVTAVDAERMPGAHLASRCPGVRVAYINGALFFGNAVAIAQQLSQADACHTLVISMRGVPSVDMQAADVLDSAIRNILALDGIVYIAGVQPAVRTVLDRVGITRRIGETQYCWDAASAIQRIHDEIALHGCIRCDEGAHYSDNNVPLS
jgi:SulP family sulfate permease